MVFSSLIFLFAYLVMTLTLYFLSPLKWRNVVLLITSLIFYGYGEPVYIFIMFLSIFIDYFHGLLVEKYRDDDKKARRFVGQSVAFNLLLLGFFKYWDFLAVNLAAIGLNLPVLGIPLPIGISFFTFQTMSYTIDVYRKEAPVQRNILTFGTFVTMFPQLIAGPIVQYKTVAKELNHRVHTSEDFALGARRFCVGLAKKVLLANSIGALWDVCLAAQAAGEMTILRGWMGLFAFGFQIYFDFSGYSDMAIGIGWMMGFRFNENFRYPYCASSVTDFWRRWHMSMTDWFRQYLYIPLGGNRGGTWKALRNTLIVWFCTGLWHGASWNFIIWGMYFAAWLILEKFILREVLKKTPAFIKHFYSIIVVFVGWGIFAIEDLSLCGGYLATCFGNGSLWQPSDLYYLKSYAITFILLIVSSTELGKNTWARLPIRVQQILTPILMGASLIIGTAYLVDGSYNPFLYFRV